MIYLYMIGLAGTIPFIILDAILAGEAAKTGFTPWMTIVWLIIWWGPLLVKFVLILAKIWWKEVMEK